MKMGKIARQKTINRNHGIYEPEWRYPQSRICGTASPEWRFRIARNTHMNILALQYRDSGKLSTDVPEVDTGMD